jgi:hypothetical protein
MNERVTVVCQRLRPIERDAEAERADAALAARGAGPAWKKQPPDVWRPPYGGGGAGEQSGESRNPPAVSLAPGSEAPSPYERVDAKAKRVISLLHARSRVHSRRGAQTANRAARSHRARIDSQPGCAWERPRAFGVRAGVGARVGPARAGCDRWGAGRRYRCSLRRDRSKASRRRSVTKPVRLGVQALQLNSCASVNSCRRKASCV